MKKILFFAIILAHLALPAQGMEWLPTNPFTKRAYTQETAQVSLEEAFKEASKGILKDKGINVFLADKHNLDTTFDENGYNLLHTAAIHNHPKTIATLIARGAAVDAPDQNGLTALQHAIASNSLEAIQELLKHDAQVNEVSRGLLPINLAIVKQQPQTVALLLPKMDKTILAKTDIKGNTLLHLAAIQGNPEIIQLLVKANFSLDSINNENDTPLHKAVQFDNIEAIQQLLKLGANPNAKNKSTKLTPYTTAQQKGNPAILALFAKNKAQQTLLLSLTRLSDDQLTALIQNGADVNEANQLGETALHSAVRHRNFNTVKQFIKFKANVNVHSNDGTTPLHLAALHNTPEIAVALITAGANVDAQNEHGHTPLYIAAFHGNLDLVKLLLHNGANLTPEINTMIEKAEKKQQALKPPAVQQPQAPVIEPKEEIIVEIPAVQIPVRIPVEEHAQYLPTVESSPGSPGFFIPSKSLQPAEQLGIPQLFPQYPAQPPAQPQPGRPKKWSEPFDWIAGTALGASLIYLGLMRESIPQISNKTDLYAQLILALKNKKYEYAYRLVHNNPQAAHALSSDPAMKEDLKELIDQTEHDLIQGTITAATSTNPFAQIGHPALSVSLKHLTDLLYLIEHPAKGTGSGS